MAATQQQGAGPGGAGRPPVVVFDWDCTITERHMFFCFENGAEDAWHHAQHFSGWCKECDIPDPLLVLPREGLTLDDLLLERMSFGGGPEGDALLRRVFIEYFMGGQERLAQVQALLTELKYTHGCRLCVLTKGSQPSLKKVFDDVLTDWWEFFDGWVSAEGDWIGAVREARTELNASAQGSLGELHDKKDILEAYFPFTEHRVMLVDDSESQDTDAVSADAVGVTSVPGHNGGAIEVRTTVDLVCCCR